MADVVGAVEVTRVSGDDELFRRHALDDLALVLDLPAHENIEKRGREPGHRVGLAFTSLDSLQGGDGAVGLQYVDLRLVEARVAVLAHVVGRRGVPLDDAQLGRQRVLQP